jgi:hypothetical protein
MSRLEAQADEGQNSARAAHNDPEQPDLGLQTAALDANDE